MSSKKILLGHGGGGLLSRELIDNEIVSRFGNGPLKGLPDGARLELDSNKLIFSTDSFVVSPTAFPGGNIGHLAVHGTVNDVAVAGGIPRYISLALILEEGLELESLRTVLDSVAEAASDCGVQIATGDTKVVAAGQADGIYINTAGIGTAIPELDLSTDRIEKGDVLISSGNLGDHGMTIMTAREGIELGDGLRSDTGPVHRLVNLIADLGPDIRFMRDPTRGGAATVINEMVEGKNIGVLLEEKDLPFSRGARGLADVMGFDLLHMASEGRVILVCAESRASEVLDRWTSMAEGRDCKIMGTVNDDAGRVTLRTAIGGKRLVDVPQGELLPRIC
ncbi:MAG: hydrogenase expression/formation protein HypE [Proteobacteria bacterium]|nr:hydrogenase expression/formation protein HypE [Pseudomonadota bacterium]